MSDDLLLPSEIEAVAEPKPKKVSKDEREAAYANGIWTDGRGRQIHISEMVTPYVESVLDFLWRSEVKRANPAILEWDGNEENVDPTEVDDEDIEERWYAHPFVIVALQALEYRHVAYTPPFERKLPF